jgi:hypothetical protein
MPISHTPSIRSFLVPGHVITHSRKLPFESANSPFAERQRIADRNRPLPNPLRRFSLAEWYLTTKLGPQESHFIVPFFGVNTTVEKEPVWKDLMVEINCIPPQLNLWYRVVCIGGIGGIGVLLIVFLDGINEIYNFFHLFFLQRLVSNRAGHGAGSSRYSRPSGGRHARRGPLRPAAKCGTVRPAGSVATPAAALPSRPAPRDPRGRPSAGWHGQRAPWRPPR